jgi:hypothetical protein
MSSEAIIAEAEPKMRRISLIELKNRDENPTKAV